jgi:hypothetical protein
MRAPAVTPELDVLPIGIVAIETIAIGIVGTTDIGTIDISVGIIGATAVGIIARNCAKGPVFSAVLGVPQPAPRGKSPVRTKSVMMLTMPKYYGYMLTMPKYF